MAEAEVPEFDKALLPEIRPQWKHNGVTSLHENEWPVV